MRTKNSIPAVKTRLPCACPDEIATEVCMGGGKRAAGGDPSARHNERNGAPWTDSVHM